MRYLLLIYEAERATDPTPEEAMANSARYAAFTADVRQRGLFRAGEALEPTNTATTVRVREGEVLTTDGPFAETREQLGGYYMIEAKNLDEAIAIAARVPSAKSGSIEVRPVMVYG